MKSITTPIGELLFETMVINSPPGQLEVDFEIRNIAEDLKESIFKRVDEEVDLRKWNEDKINIFNVSLSMFINADKSMRAYILVGIQEEGNGLREASLELDTDVSSYLDSIKKNILEVIEESYF